MTHPHPADAGLRAVARVRDVREQDSRSGLRMANDEVAEARDRLGHLEDAVRRGIPDAGTTSAATWTQARQALTALSTRVGTAREDLTMSSAIADAALVRWQADRARLQAVEVLLTRRADVRRADRERADARELDDLALQRHRRREDR